MGVPGEEGSSPAFSTADSPFIADPGPPAEAGGERDTPAAAGPGELHALPPLPDLWEEPQIRSLLAAKGAVIHGVIGVADRDWIYTEADLAAISPPLTRILNRYDATRAAAGAGDELALAVGLGGYALRSWRERNAALAALAELGPEPITGAPAPAGTGPQPDQEDPWTTPATPPMSRPQRR